MSSSQIIVVFSILRILNELWIKTFLIPPFRKLPGTSLVCKCLMLSEVLESCWRQLPKTFLHVDFYFDELLEHLDSKHSCKECMSNSSIVQSMQGA